MLQRSPISHIPLLPLTTAFIVGIIAGTYLFSITIVASTVVIAVMAALMRRYHIAALITAVAMGICDAGIAFTEPTILTSLHGVQQTYSGTVSGLHESDSSQSFIVTVDKCGSDPGSLYECPIFRVAVTVPGFSTAVSDGDIITFRAILTRPQSDTDLPDETDYDSKLLSERIYLKGFVTEENISEVSAPSGMGACFLKMRRHITQIIYRSRLSPESKEFLNTTLTGDSSGLSPDMRRTFMSGGLAHILAISGLHVGIIAFIVSIAMWPLYVSGHNKLRFALTILSLWIFAAITGLSPSVTRAVLMATIMLAARIIERRSSPLNSLCAAALVILLLDPPALYSISFQMSFSAVASILLFARALNPVSPRRRIAYNCVAYITVSASAMLGTGLIAAIYFHSFPAYFLLTNIAAAMLLPLIIGGGLLLVISEAGGLDLYWLSQGIDLCFSAITHVTRWTASLPGAYIDSIYIPAWLVIPYAVILVTLKLWLNSRKPLHGAIFATAVTAMTVLTASLPRPDNQPALYIGRGTQHTDLVVNDGGHTLRIITSRHQELEAVKARAEFRYRDYMVKRSIDSLSVTAPQPGTNDTTIIFKGKRITLLTGRIGNDSHHTDYLITCRGTRDSIAAIAATYGPDTIMISRDLDIRRAEKYASECRRLGIPYISLRERGWSLPAASMR